MTTARKSASRGSRVTRLGFGFCVVDDAPESGRIRDENHEYVYCVYDTDNDVTMYETYRDALAGKLSIERLVDAVGPFRMPRHELPLVRAAARVLRYLKQRTTSKSTPRTTLPDEVVNELGRALASVFPFQSVRLSDGSTFRVRAKSRHDARK